MGSFAFKGNVKNLGKLYGSLGFYCTTSDYRYSIGMDYPLVPGVIRLIDSSADFR